MMRLRSMSRAFLILVPILIMATGGAAWANLGSSYFVNSPSSSGSLGAGLINPAAWAVQGSGGTYLAIQHPDETEEFGDLGWTYIGSAESIAFSYQNLPGLDEDRIQNWALGMAFGDASFSGGFSYKWMDDVLAVDDTVSNDRWNFGMIKRARAWSLGMSADVNTDFAEGSYLADLGVRPFGPRMTLFGEGRYIPLTDGGDEEYRLNYGFGAEIMAMPGLSISGRYNLSGYDADVSSFSLGMQVSFGGGSRNAYIADMGEGLNDQNETTTEFRGGTYVAESGRLGSILPFSWQGAKYPEVDLKGGLPYRRFGWFDDGRTFKSLLEQINRYAENPKTEGVVLNLSGFYADPEMLMELRDQLAGLRAEGKRVVIYIDRVGLFGYMLASVADELWMDPLGDINVMGLAFGNTYMAATLEKLGVGIQEHRYFKFKSAVETLSRNEPSEGQTEQMDALLEDWYETAVSYSIESRGMSREVWNKAVEEFGDLLPQEALEMGFVDKLGDWNDMKEDVDEIEMRDTQDLSATQLAGLRGDPVWRNEHWGVRPKIALLYAEGGCSMDTGIKGRLLSRKIRKVRENKSVKAVVLRVDSPGGDPLPSDLVARELKLTMEEKPVIISQGFVAASGGYWISMYSDKILASPLTVTGSIGVISAHIYDKNLGEKLGMSYHGVQRGSHADINRGINLPLLGGLPHRPKDEGELDRTEYAITTLYEDFIKQVAEGRGMTEEAVAEVAQGRVWSGIDGKENGLVDELGGLWMALQMAKDAAGIDADMPISIVEGPGLGNFDFGMFTPKLLGIDMETVEKAANPASQYFTDRELLYLETLKDAKGNPVTMMEPFSVIDGAEVY